MTKKTKIIVICIAAAVALSAVTAAVISLSRRNKKPADETVDSSSVSQESSSAPDFAIKVTPSSDSSSAVQSDVKSRSEAVSEEISPEAFKKTVDAAACFYYMSFDSSSLSVRDCFDILESLTVEQSITGQNDFFPAERKDFSNLVTKDTAAAVFPSFWENQTCPTPPVFLPTDKAMSSCLRGAWALPRRPFFRQKANRAAPLN